MATKNGPLKIVLHGMDARCIKTMALFLQKPCENMAIVVLNADEAQIDLFDLDSPISKGLLDTHLQETIQKPVIVLSLQDIELKDVLSLKKPVKTDDMLLVLRQAKKLIGKSLKASPNKMPAPDKLIGVEQAETIEVESEVTSENALPEQNPTPEPPPPSQQAEVEELRQQVADVEDRTLKTYVFDKDECKKTAKHQTAMRLDEKGFREYIGADVDIDVNDPSQFSKAHYNPTNYYMGTVQSAIAACRGKDQSFSLHSNWKPIILLPHSQEIGLNGSDAELKMFAGIKLKHRNTKATTLRLIPIDAGIVNIGSALNKFQSMESVLWKLACWTSMGRYPHDIDYRKPVYLKNWPNFTRLLVTPHALRIAALLVQNPRTMGNIAETLDIKPQYVFTFISAAHAIGLSGQGRRVSDSLVEALTKKRSINDMLPLNSIVKKMRDIAN